MGVSRWGLPSISAPVDEIWLRNRLAVPISSWQLLLGLERNTLQAEPLARLLIFSSPASFSVFTQMLTSPKF